MTFHLDWSLLDSTVSDAVQDFVNAKLDSICQQRIHEFEQTQFQQLSQNNNGLLFIKPLANVKVTKIWWGTEPPLLEILEIGQAPPPATTTTTTTTNQQQQQLSNSVSTNPSFSGSPQTGHIINNQKQHGLKQTKSSDESLTTQQCRQDSVSTTASSSLANSASPSTSAQQQHQHSTKYLPSGGQQKSSIRTISTINLNRSGTISNSSGNRQMSSMDRSSFQPASTTTTATSKNSPRQQLPPLASAIRPQNQNNGPSSLMEAILGTNGLQMRIHLVHSGSAGFELCIDPEVHIYQNSNFLMNLLSSFATGGGTSGVDLSSSSPPSGGGVVVVSSSTNTSPASPSPQSPTTTTTTNAAGAGSKVGSINSTLTLPATMQNASTRVSGIQNNNSNNSSSNHVMLKPLASIRMPMLFEVSDFHFDIVINVCIRSRDGVTVKIEPDRFGGEGAEGRILSSLSITAKIGSGLLGGGDETLTKKESRSEVLVDTECARSLVLKELRAILARTLVKGFTVPVKK